MKLYTPPLTKRLIQSTRLLLKPFLKLAVLVFAIRGKYPPILLTPDDPVSPFGSGTTPGASIEPTQMAIYRRFGRYIGDVVWLGWRNSGYGLNYYLKPDWLKDKDLQYMHLTIIDKRTPGPDGKLEGDLYTERTDRVGTVWVRGPYGAWLWETTRKFGPIYVITGYRLSPIASGARENLARKAAGLDPVPRPAFHPNMDGRPIFSIRTKRTM